jgi:hypothetical protein
MDGWLGRGNDPAYVESRCFETFPFPAEDTALTPALLERISSQTEQIDAHRRRQQAARPRLTLTRMYNVLEALRSGRALTAKEKTIPTDGLVAVLASLHAELDAGVDFGVRYFSNLLGRKQTSPKPPGRKTQREMLAAKAD